MEKKFKFKKRGKYSKKSNDDESQFFKLWPKDFHRPYGPGLQPDELEDEIFQKRLTTVNCYWFQDPAKAVSTLVSTLEESCEVIRMMEFEKQDWAKHVDNLQALSRDIGVLNVRGGRTGDWEESLKKLQDFISDIENQAFFKYYAIFGANIWLPNLLLTTMVYIVNNLKEVHRKISPFATEELKAWSRQGNEKSVRRFLKNTVTAPKDAGTSSSLANDRRSFLHRLTPSRRDRSHCSNNSSGSDSNSTGKTKKSARRSRGKHRYTESHNSTDSDSDSHSNADVRKRRETKRVVSSDSDSDDVQLTTKKVKARKLALTPQLQGPLEQLPVVTTEPPVPPGNDAQELQKPKKKRSKKASSTQQTHPPVADASRDEIPLPVLDVDHAVDHGKRKRRKKAKTVVLTETSTTPPQDVGGVVETEVTSTSSEAKVKKHKKKKLKGDNFE